jgi:hypothetical protein
MAAAMLQSVIGSEVDRGATFRRVEAEIDAIFRDERYSGLLAGLRDERPLLSYGPDVTRATRRSILAGIDSCRRPDDIDVGRHERCSGMVDALIGYASQFPRLADRPEAALNRAFERAAILLRSAAVNDGLSARSLDRHSRSTAEFWAGTVHGWVGFGASPAGLYSWPVRPRAHGWMHKVPGRSADGAPNSVELTFYGGDLRGPAANVLSEIRPIDVEGTTVTIRLDWFPDTEPALLAEARSVVDSIVIQPTDSGHRLVFRLEEGWDKG